MPFATLVCMRVATLQALHASSMPQLEKLNSLRNCFCCAFEHGHRKARHECRELRETIDTDTDPVTARGGRERGSSHSYAHTYAHAHTPHELPNLSLAAVDPPPPKKRAATHTGNATADVDIAIAVKRLRDLSRNISFLTLT